MYISCVDILSETFVHKQLSYRRGAARCAILVEILSTAAQQYKNRI